MQEGYRGPCIVNAGRATNDELCSWLKADAHNDSSLFGLLFPAVAPLLEAFFEGQMHGAHRGQIEVLIQNTLIAVCRRRAIYDPSRPFRAWLLELAREQRLIACPVTRQNEAISLRTTG